METREGWHESKRVRASAAEETTKEINMDTETMIRQLRAIEEKERAKPRMTFEIDWSQLCHDAADRLQELLDQNNANLQKHAHWQVLEVFRDGIELVRCSCCNNKAFQGKIAKYCNVCGARMDLQVEQWRRELK